MQHSKLATLAQRAKRAHTELDAATEELREELAAAADDAPDYTDRCRLKDAHNLVDDFSNCLDPADLDTAIHLVATLEEPLTREQFHEQFQLMLNRWQLEVRQIASELDHRIYRRAAKAWGRTALRDLDDFVSCFPDAHTPMAAPLHPDPQIVRRYADPPSGPI